MDEEGCAHRERGGTASLSPAACRENPEVLQPAWHALAVHLVQKLKIPTVHWESFSSGDQMKDRYCFRFFMGRIRGYWRSGEKRGVSRSPSVKRILLQTEHRELNTASGPAEDCAWHFISVEKSGQSVPCFRIYRHQDRVRELQFNTKPIS